MELKGVLVMYATQVLNSACQSLPELVECFLIGVNPHYSPLINISRVNSLIIKHFIKNHTHKIGYRLQISFLACIIHTHLKFYKKYTFSSVSSYEKINMCIYINA